MQIKGLCVAQVVQSGIEAAFVHSSTESHEEIVEKHHVNHLDVARIFVFDDFIHVIDTLLNFFPYPIDNVLVEGRQKNGQLYHVILQLEAEQGTAIGIMNRDAGINEEVVKVFSPTETRIVKNINEVAFLKGREVANKPYDDWEPMLQKRGFYRMTRTFIDAVKSNDPTTWAYEIDLQRHIIAEK